jgi:hypothetical protein
MQRDEPADPAGGHAGAAGGGDGGGEETEMREFRTSIGIEVVIRVADGVDPFERVTGPEGDEFRKTLYELRTQEEVLDHWAYNAACNGVTDASELDGWADLEKGQVTMFPDSAFTV